MRFASRLLPTVVLALLPLLAAAQDGGITGPTSSKDAAGYSCDPSKCKLPNCACASTSPPGGLDPKDVPQFIVFTADDAIQSYTIDAVNQLLAHRQNPNGCRPKMTYYTQINYTNYTLVTDWFVAGNEIADHTMTHMPRPSAQEINGNLFALNALAGIPLSSIIGFRAPELDFTVDTLKALHAAQFTYDSSSTASIPVTDPDTDAYWPYTLDNGMANNCLSTPGICKGEPKLPGFWEIPMYAFFDKRGVNGPHLMDPWLEPANGGTKVDDSATLDYMKSTFTDHYNNNRQPIGLYTHPIHISTTYPGQSVPKSTITMINAFLDWAQEQQNVWIVSSEQLLAWVRNPVPVSRLGELDALKCSTPKVDQKICNGMPSNEAGLLNLCAFPDFPFYTCYGCPTTPPTPANPNPPQNTTNGDAVRFRIPANCTTPFWDPVAGKCLCTARTCQFQDNSRAIGPNGANLTGGALGGDFDSPSASSTAYVSWNGVAPTFPAGIFPAILVGCIGGIIGTLSIFL